MTSLLAQRDFDGTDDTITCPVGGSTAFDFGPATIAFLITRGTGGNNFQSLMMGLTSTSVIRGSIEINNTGDTLSYYNGTTDFDSGLSVPTSDGASIVVYRKASGSAVPRWSKCVLSTGTWSHVDAGGAATDATSIGAGGFWRFAGIASQSSFDGAMAWATVFNSELTDGQVESFATDIATIAALGPAHLWIFDQPITTAFVLDVIGTADDIGTIVGTAVIAPPTPAYSYESSIAAEVVAQAAEFGTSLGSANAQPAFTIADTPDVGDLMLRLVGNDTPGATDITASTGHTVLGHTTQGSNAIKGAWIARLADGGANDALDVTGAAQDYCAYGLLIRGHGVTDVNSIDDATRMAVTTGTTGNADPPSLDTGAVGDYLVVSGCVIDLSAAAQLITQGPTDYYAPVNWLRSASNSTSVALGIAVHTVTATQTINPAAFANTSRPWIAWTLAIPLPAAVTGPPLPFARPRNRLLLR